MPALHSLLFTSINLFDHLTTWNFNSEGTVFHKHFLNHCSAYRCDKPGGAVGRRVGSDRPALRKLEHASVAISGISAR